MTAKVSILIPVYHDKRHLNLAGFGQYYLSFSVYLYCLNQAQILFSLRLLTLALLWFGYIAKAQEIRSLSFAGATVVPHEADVGGSRIGGLSGITYHPASDRYFMVADKHPARLFQAKITLNDSLVVSFARVIELSPSLLAQSELEGIAFEPQTGSFIVSDEQKDGTRILAIDVEGRFIRIIEPVNQAFLPLSSYNSGIEGLTISHDGQTIFYAFEKSTQVCQAKGLVRITRLPLNHSGQRHHFWYQLHTVANDKAPTNGISEILYLNDSALLVMERAYIPGTGNVVRLYKAKIPPGPPSVPCESAAATPLTSELLFDFSTVEGFAIDNAEGMTFNADKSLLLIVTDNNFSRKQQTQLVALRVQY